VLLVLEAAVPQLAQPIEEDGARQRIPGLPLAQPHMHAAAQFCVLQPLQREERALDAAQPA
jgi:hypothetical protein